MSGSFAAHAGSLTVCPAADPKPHVGGPLVITGKRTVYIGGLPAAVEGDTCTCLGPPPNRVKEGSDSVLINGKAACRMGDGTTHGGRVITGCPVVLIG
jgi:uncharacterized Zn-binding protein involved in type VI secretion